MSPDQPPSRLYLPIRRPEPGAEMFELELRTLRDGQLAMLTFSDLDRLVAGCGEGQPWALVPTGSLDEARESAQADVVLLDVPLPEHLRRPAGARR